MTKLAKFKHPSGGYVVMLAFALHFFAVPGNAQFGAAAAQSQQGSLANPLPLSGRSGASGGVIATQTAIPGTTTSVNTLNPTVLVSGAYSGSANSTSARPFSGKLSLQEAVERAIAYNLGAVGMNQALRQVHGQTRVARSALLPNLNGDFSETDETVNLAAIGVRFNVPTVPGVPSFGVPTLVGPFNYMDLRARLTQTVADFTARNNYRAAQENLRAAQLSADDARNLVVLATGGAYLQVIAAEARVQSAQAQLETANAVYQQTQMQLQFGKVPQIDVNRSQVEVLTQKQRLVSLQNDVAKQKINLARLTGLPPSEQYDISDDVPVCRGSANHFRRRREAGSGPARGLESGRSPGTRCGTLAHRGARRALSIALDKRGLRPDRNQSRAGTRDLYRRSYSDCANLARWPHRGRYRGGRRSPNTATGGA